MESSAINNSTSAAPSTLFLGQNGEFWDSWLIVALIFTTVAAAAVLMTTIGSIQSHKREAFFATNELDRFKIQAQLQILTLHKRVEPRRIDRASLLASLKDRPKEDIELMFVKDDADATHVADAIKSASTRAGWNIELIPIARSDDLSATGGGPPVGVRLYKALGSVSGPEYGTMMGIAEDEPTSAIIPNTPIVALWHGLSLQLGFIAFSNDLSKTLPSNVIRVVVGPKA